MKLISMTDFVLEQDKIETECYDFDSKVVKYAKFLNQELKIEMFVPCDENHNILVRPKKYDNWNDFNYSGTDIGFEDEKLCREYQKAKEKVLFEEFEFFDKHQNCLNNMLGDFGVFKYGDDFGITTHEKGKGYHTYFHIKNIEDLIRIEKGITLTENALKQLQIINNK